MTLQKRLTPQPWPKPDDQRQYGKTLSVCADAYHRSMSLCVQTLSFAYHSRTPVLREITASFEPGTLTAILGPNGSGKSTLLRLMLGLLKPDAGSVRINSRDVHAMHEPDRARMIAYIPQRPSVAFGFSVADIVALGCGPQTPAALARTTAAEALETVGLTGRAGEPFAELSMGQQQRAVLARSLAQLDAADRITERDTPRALLADEPTSAMDPRHAVEAMQVLRTKAGRGRTVVVVLHDPTAALRHADRVLLLDAAGVIAACGPTAETLDPATLSRVFEVGFTRLADPATGAVAIIPTEPIPSNRRRY